MRTLLASLTVLAGASCQNLECGENTIERDGKCVAATNPPGVTCGPGTYFEPSSGRCVSLLVGDGGGLCGDNTTIITNDAGQPVCVGTGGGVDCAQSIICPAPTDSNFLSICGRIYDLEDSTPLDDGNPNNGEPYRDVTLRIYDPLAYAMNPDTATVIKTGAPDSCGRYAITNVPIDELGSGFVAVATDDAGSIDNLVQTGIADVAQRGATLTDRRAWIFRRTTDTAWSAQAGFSGNSFGTMGVYIPIFLSGDPLPPFSVAAPTASVQVALVTSQRDAKPEQDFYFTDTDPLLRHTVSTTPAATGANGTALFINAGLGMYSGLGAEPTGACWQINLAAAPVGAAFVQERLANAESCL